MHCYGLGSHSRGRTKETEKLKLLMFSSRRFKVQTQRRSRDQTEICSPYVTSDHRARSKPTGISTILFLRKEYIISGYHFMRLDQRLNVPVHGRCGERSSIIELRTTWFAVRDLSQLCASLAHQQHSNSILTALIEPKQRKIFFPEYP